MGASFDTTGLNRLAASLTQAGIDAIPAADVVVRKTSADIKRDAQALAPVDTGFLRGSIGYETKRGLTSSEGVVGPTAEYGAYVEDGTSRMGPQPYMGPAFDRHVDNFVDGITAIVDRINL